MSEDSISRAWIAAMDAANDSGHTFNSEYWNRIYADTYARTLEELGGPR